MKTSIFKKGLKAQSVYSFYILDEDKNMWYFDGNNFTKDCEESVIYGCNNSVEWLKEHYRESPQYKKILEFGLKDEEIKVDIG